MSVAGTIAGFSGTVTLNLHGASNGEIIDTTTRSGDGSYSFTWYDDTEDVYVDANDGINFGRSAHGPAGVGSFDIIRIQPVVRAFA